MHELYFLGYLKQTQSMVDFYRPYRHTLYLTWVTGAQIVIGFTGSIRCCVIWCAAVKLKCFFMLSICHTELSNKEYLLA